MTSERAIVLIVDDERNIRETLAELVESEGFTARQAANGAEARAQLADRTIIPDAILLDIRMAGTDGLALLREIRDTALSDAPVIMVSAYEDSTRTIEAMKLGAYDYITKPIDLNELTTSLRRAIDQRRSALASRRVPVTGASEEVGAFGCLIGTSRPMREVLKHVGRVAATDATVLIAGESGTGKELVARAIHEHSTRVRAPFITMNCGAIAETLVVAELFGHERGAFTGADRQRKGRLELAHRGTLFLDEVGELSQGAQVALLRALQERRFERVGGAETVTVDVRVIAATNKDLKEQVALQHFREDLFYRLDVLNVELPPLRARRGDIPALAEQFIERACTRHGGKTKSLADESLRALLNYDFPGNVRELQNIIERAVISSRGAVIVADDLWPTGRSGGSLDHARMNAFFELPFNAAVAALERELIRRALEAAAGNRTDAARRLQINRRLLYSKMRDYELS